MKKAFSVLLALVLVFAAFSLAGCGKKEAYEIKPYATVRPDLNKVTANKNNFTAVDESWKCTITVADTSTEKLQSLLHYKEHQNGSQPERFLNRVLDNKKIGTLNYETATFTEHFQRSGVMTDEFGAYYYSKFDPELTSPDGAIVYCVYASFSGDESKLSDFEALLSTLEVNAK